jgi:hypothetical protein
MNSSSSCEAIERKADDLMRTANTIGAALVAALKLIGVTSSPSAGLTARGTFLALFVLCQVLAVVVSASTKSSAVRVTPLSVEGLLRIADREGAEHPEGDVKAVTAASIHATIVGESILVSWRARQLRRATVLFCVGLVQLFPLALLI